MVAGELPKKSEQTPVLKPVRRGREKTKKEGVFTG